MEYIVREIKSIDIIMKLRIINLKEMKEENERNKGIDFGEMFLSD